MDLGSTGRRDEPPATIYPIEGFSNPNTDNEIQEFRFVPDRQILLVGRASTAAEVIVEFREATDEETAAFFQELVDVDAPIEKRSFPQSRHSKWEIEDYRRYGSWLLPPIVDLDAGISHHVVLTRSYQLGAGPSRDRITDPKRFGSVAKFVKESGIEPRVRYGKYDDWKFEDFVNHIKSVIEEAGTHKITQEMLWTRISEGRDEPSPAVIRAKATSLSAVFKAAGIRSKVQLTDSEYKQVIIDYMVAHDGEEPTIDQLDELSKQGKSPSPRTMARRYGSLKTLKEEAREIYDQLNDEQRRTGQEIQEALDQGDVPISLFRGVSSGEEMVHRFWRYQKVKTLASIINEPPDNFLNLCIGSYSPSELAIRLTQKMPGLQPEIIKSAILSLG